MFKHWPERQAYRSLELSIATDHPAFAGHFPGYPIVPGVVLLDSAIRAVCRQEGLDLSELTISSAKFHAPATPGAGLRLLYRIEPNGQISFDILSCGAAEYRTANGLFFASRKFPELSVEPFGPAG